MWIKMLCFLVTLYTLHSSLFTCVPLIFYFELVRGFRQYCADNSEKFLYLAVNHPMLKVGGK